MNDFLGDFFETIKEHIAAIVIILLFFLVIIVVNEIEIKGLKEQIKTQAEYIEAQEWTEYIEDSRLETEYMNHVKEMRG